MVLDEILYRISGVIEVKMNNKIGDRMQNRRSSVFYNGIVYFMGKTLQDILNILDLINRAYYVEVKL